MTSIRMLLAVACQNMMKLRHFDIQTAFLNGDLEENLYMESPEGYNNDPNKVCKLLKGLYGLKQAPKNWNQKFDSFLKKFNLRQASVDKCLYFDDERRLILAIYVDDGLAASRDESLLEALIVHLKANFSLKVMSGDFYLGLKIDRDRNHSYLTINQSNYIEKILNKFKMQDCKPVDTPEQVGAKFDESQSLPEENQFKELVGSLLYLATCTRPDIAHAVSKASRTSKPTQAHWIALKRVLRYLKGTMDLGIRCTKQDSKRMIAYSDADYANDERGDRTPVSAYTMEEAL